MQNNEIMKENIFVCPDRMKTLWRNSYNHMRKRAKINEFSHKIRNSKIKNISIKLTVMTERKLPVK